jgi:hypothetical protein
MAPILLPVFAIVGAAKAHSPEEVDAAAAAFNSIGRDQELLTSLDRRFLEALGPQASRQWDCVAAESLIMEEACPGREPIAQITLRPVFIVQSDGIWDPDIDFFGEISAIVTIDHAASDARIDRIVEAKWAYREEFGSFFELAENEGALLRQKLEAVLDRLATRIADDLYLAPRPQEFMRIKNRVQIPEGVVVRLEHDSNIATHSKGEIYYTHNAADPSAGETPTEVTSETTAAIAPPAAIAPETPSVGTSDTASSGAPSVGTDPETPSVISAQPPRIVDPAMKARIVGYLDNNMRKFELAMREYDGNLYQRAGESYKPKVRSYEVWEANEKGIVLRVLFRVYHPQTNLLLVRWVEGDLKVVGHRDVPSVAITQPPRFVDAAERARIEAYIKNNKREFELTMMRYIGRRNINASHHDRYLDTFEVIEMRDSQALLKIRLIGRVNASPTTRLFLVKWEGKKLEILSHEDIPANQQS